MSEYIKNNIKWIIILLLSNVVIIMNIFFFGGKSILDRSNDTKLNNSNNTVDLLSYYNKILPCINIYSNNDIIVLPIKKYTLLVGLNNSNSIDYSKLIESITRIKINRNEYEIILVSKDPSIFNKLDCKVYSYNKDFENYFQLNSNSNFTIFLNNKYKIKLYKDEIISIRNMKAVIDYEIN